MDTQVTFLCNVVCIVLIMLPVKCNMCPTNCRACTNIEGENVCALCNGGYWLSGSSCQHCSNNCATCINESSCGTCKPGFHSLDSACHLPCSTNCLGDVCDENTGHCVKCPSGRYGNYCEQDCGLCNNEQCKLRKCTSGCKSGYWEYQNDDNFDCRVCMDNCSFCDSWEICKICHDGTYLSEYNGVRNYCFLCPSGCEKCSSYSSCSACKPGYYGVACQHQCSDTIPDCEMCDWDGASTVTCSQCANDWTLQDNKCLVSPQQCTMHCERCIEDNVCELCKEGRIGELCDKTCRDDILHCATCLEAGGSIVCKVCDEGYAVMDGECRAIKSHLTSTTSAPTETTTKTSTSSIYSEPPVSEYSTLKPQHNSTSFQTSAFFVGLVTGIGISICAILLICSVRFLMRRKRLQTSSTTHENEPNYENSFAAPASHLTTMNTDDGNQENIQQMRTVEENDREPVDNNHQTPVGGESVSTYTNIDQHDYTSLNVRHGEHIYKDFTAL